MSEYVYVLSHPRMPNTIKVGKTTRSISQRMSELHTTGVPEPFNLECAFEVDDCALREKKAHAALVKSRINSGREFFEVTVEQALKKIVPVLGDFKVHYVKDCYDIPALVEKQRRKDENDRLKEKAKLAERRRMALIEVEKKQVIKEIENKLLAEQAEIHKWYRCEVAKEFPEMSPWRFVVPLAIICFALLPVFFPKLTDPGVAIFTALISWYGAKIIKNWAEGRRKDSLLWKSLDNELEVRLKSVKEHIYVCSNCGNKLRFDRAKLLNPNFEFATYCPICQSSIPFDAIKCGN